MAADVFQTQAWDNTGWGWDQATAGSPCEQLCSALSAWITAINANAAQSGKQVVLERDETSSTTANYRGFTINMPAITTTGSLYYQLYSNSTTNMVEAWGNTFTDDTSNGGYGTVSGGSSDTNHSWKLDVSATGVLNIAYGSVNGEEYFVCGWKLDSSTTYADFFMFYKDTFGEWAVVRADGTTTTGYYYDSVMATPKWNDIVGDSYAYTTGILTTCCYPTSSAGLVTGDKYCAFCVPKSPDLFNHPNDEIELTYLPNGSTGEYLAKIAYYGPFIAYTPV